MLKTELASLPDSEPLFTNAFAAVRFAVTRDGRFGRPLFAKLLVSEGQSLRALGMTPYESAAQAGFILSELRKLTRLQFSCVVAKAAPSLVTCSCRRPCCSGKKVSSEWSVAVNDLTSAAGCEFPELHWTVREALVVKIYGSSAPLNILAKKLNLELEDIVRHHRAMIRWLQGSRVRGGVAVEGIEPLAWRDAESILRNCGIVG